VGVGPGGALWMARQVVHEVEHHLGDIEENAAELD
jgi:hypothetical protein